MKRLLTSILAGVIVFGLVAAFAATLNVTDGGLGAGQVAVGNCDADGAVSISYTHAWDDVDTRYEITELTVDGISAPACKTISVRFGATDLAVNAGVDAGAESFTLTNVPATATADVHVALGG